MSFEALRVGMVSTLSSDLPTGTKVYSHEGAFTTGDIERCARQAPCAVVGFDRTRTALEGGVVVGTVDAVVVVIVKDAAGVPRDLGMLRLLKEALRITTPNRWGVDSAQRPTNVTARNFYTPDLARTGCAIWAIGFEQRVDLLPDVDPLTDNLLDFRGNWDLVTTDGLYEAQDQLELDGDT